MDMFERAAGAWLFVPLCAAMCAPLYKYRLPTRETAFPTATGIAGIVPHSFLNTSLRRRVGAGVGF